MCAKNNTFELGHKTNSHGAIRTDPGAASLTGMNVIGLGWATFADSLNSLDVASKKKKRRVCWPLESFSNFVDSHQKLRRCNKLGSYSGV